MRFGNFGKHIHPLPDSVRLLDDGQELQIDANTWRVIVGTDPSSPHACLDCPPLKVLISGEQALPRMASNVSVYPTESDTDPMRGWLDSLAKIKREVPDDVLVLPADNEFFRGLHARIDALASGPERSLERWRRSLKEHKRAVDVFGALFARAIGEAAVQLLDTATNESLALLNYLLDRGELSRDVDAKSVDIAAFRRKPDPARARRLRVYRLPWADNGFPRLGNPS